MDIHVYKGSAWTSITDGTISSLVAYDGLGLPPSHDITERGPSQHGDTYIDFRLDPRYITLVLGVTGTGYSNLLTKVRNLTSLVKHRNTVIPIRFTTDIGDQRLINVVYREGLTLPLSVEGSYHYRMGIELKASDPVFSASSATTSTYDVDVGDDFFVVPTPVPTQMGQSFLDKTADITYDGTWRVFPTIRINGPITDCVIDNLTTDEKLDFTGTEIASTDYYDVDCTYPNKTVQNSASANKAADLTDDSDLVTFHLEADPDSASGINSMRVRGRSITSETSVVFTYTNLFVEL